MILLLFKSHGETYITLQYITQLPSNTTYYSLKIQKSNLLKYTFLLIKD